MGLDRWDGMEWDGMGWDGMGRTAGRPQDGMGLVEREWDGIKKNYPALFKSFVDIFSSLGELSFL